MSTNSTIEWTDVTWNPVTGCTRISHGCKHCYAERMSRRLMAMGATKYSRGFEVVEHPSTLMEPSKWKKPRRVFVNSMSDLFHDEVSEGFIREVFTVMAETPHHTFQVLTKRPQRLVAMDGKLDWSPNIWMGVSIESARWVDRLHLLSLTGAQTKFLSLEPLLGPLADLDLASMDWVIVGGESGTGARPMKPGWVRAIRDSCLAQEVPFFFKQWGGTQKYKSGRELDGQIWDQYPSPVQ